MQGALKSTFWRTFMNKILAAALSVLLISPLAAVAQPATGERSFTLSGNGASDENFDGNVFGVSAEIGQYYNEQLLWGIRQSINGAAGDEVNDAWNGSTRLFADYHFGTGKARPYVGANIGGIYGDGIKETGTAGFDLGLKYFVKEKTFIAVGAEYQFLFDSGEDIDNNYDDGAIFYTVGVGFNF